MVKVIFWIVPLGVLKRGCPLFWIKKKRRPQTSLAATNRKSIWLGMARFLPPLPFNFWGTHQLRSKFHFITGVIPRAASPAMMQTWSLGEELYKREEAPVTRFCRTNRGWGLIWFLRTLLVQRQPPIQNEVGAPLGQRSCNSVLRSPPETSRLG